MNNNKIIKYSKFLSFVLRHEPESIGISLDENGWVDVAELLHACNNHKKPMSLELLKEVVETNNKKRFAFNESGDRIRASQGHSIKTINLDLKAIEPPEILYHGTVEKFMNDIQSSGLRKMNRQHVHLSHTKATATNVGSRRGKPIILEISALQMHTAGFKFYRSANGVWLTDAIPWDYIELER